MSAGPAGRTSAPSGSSGTPSTGSGPDAGARTGIDGRSAPGTRRPGGRTARVREAALAATLEVLTDKGFDGLSVDAVATRSGVHRATLHRRWGDVGGLLADALDSSAGEGWTPPDTGSLDDDLAAINEEVREALVAPRSVTAAVIAASFRSEPAAAAMRRFLADRYERSAVVVDRAVARGDAVEGTDAHTVLLAATAPVYHRVLLLGDPPDAATARRYAELAAAAVTGHPQP
ncbi:TetR-like C-terminal domain-containing protein [Pseudonocardia endophytica]|uniref:TetR family transcriptional regulator n=1 Tax=Pseudonocardia endophytica TaxID=401976 RepID=A0A4R1HV57_PSEEN|nr:TetR-like C-terminal domain-containing protein [Pseudonocardia endophytica]TCK24865.1 TetR family transcriptional regulator [Pseudonocardia endophytica]